MAQLSTFHRLEQGERPRGPLSSTPRAAVPHPRLLVQRRVDWNSVDLSQPTVQMERLRTLSPGNPKKKIKQGGFAHLDTFDDKSGGGNSSCLLGDCLWQCEDVWSPFNILHRRTTSGGLRLHVLQHRVTERHASPEAMKRTILRGLTN